MHPNKTKTDSTRTDIKKAGGVVGRRHKSIIYTDTAYQQLVTNKLRVMLADETHPVRPVFDPHTLHTYTYKHPVMLTNNPHITIIY